MARVISQETFDGAVKENIEEFSMSNEEAVDDAIKQFESQGVNLQNIITNSLLTSEVGKLTEKVETLKKIIESDYKNPELSKILCDMKTECDTGGIAKKVLAAKCGLYDCLINFLISSEVQDQMKLTVLELLLSLMTGYPDLLDDTGIQVIENLLRSTSDEVLSQVVIKWITVCCIMHENNREKFLQNENIMNELRKFMDQETSTEILRLMCKLFQTFVLNDDIRNEFPLTHKHACQLCHDFLDPLILRLQKHSKDKKVVHSVMKALTAIIVRNEYCQRFFDAKGLELIRDIMLENLRDETMCRLCFNLIKVIAGNDQVKAKVMGAIDPSIFISTIHNYLNSEKTCTRGLVALNMLTLRNNNNCKVLCEGNVAELLIQAMKVHPNSKQLLKSVCWLIKNLTNGNEKVATQLLSLGVESCLRDILLHHEDCKFEANVALRLLGCEVDTVELWKGEGKSITN